MIQKQVSDDKASIIILITLIVSLIGIYVYTELLNSAIDNEYSSINQNNVQAKNNKPLTGSIENLKIEKEKIVYEDSISKLTTKITNSGEELKDIRYNVKLLNVEDNVFKETTLFVGDIAKDQVKYVESYFDSDITNIKEVKYEVIK